MRQGVRVLATRDGDVVVFAATCTDAQHVMAAASNGVCSTFLASDVRDQGRAARGVKAMTLKPGAR